MAHDVTDDLQRRLRAVRPRSAFADDSVFDAELLARVRAQPIAARRTVSRAVAVPIAAGVTLTATAVVMLAGGPGSVGGPSSAAAVTQALHWLNPPPDTILHIRKVETNGTHTTTRELWQSVDEPASARERVEGASTFEMSGDAFYDPATDTIYDPPAPVPLNKGTKKREAAEVEKRGEVTRALASTKPGDASLPAADPVVMKVRMLLQDGHLAVTGRESHDGVDAWAISLKPGQGRPVWTLWVSASDGKPLELRDPGRDASEPPQVIRWPTYEVLPESGSSALLTLTGAHPSATVVHDAAQSAAAQERLMP